MNTLAVPMAGAPQPAAPSLSERLGGVADALLPAAAALVITVLLFSAAVALAGFDPIEVWSLILMGGFGDAFAWQNTLQRAAPLILTGLAVALPAQAGRVIIGAEGALVLGGLAAAALGTLLSAQAPPLVVWPLMALAGMLVGGVWIGIVGWLREKREVNETIASLLMSFIAIALFNQCVETVLRDPASLNKPSTKPLPDAFLLPAMPGLDVHWGLGVGIVVALIAWAVVKLTPLGLSLRVAGGNPRTALGVGLPVAWLTIGACAAGGACAGLAGADDAPAPASIMASSAPTGTSLPSCATIELSTPEDGALTSTVTLSVSNSTSGSSALTVSPGFLNHWPTVASVTDSPSAGTLISIVMSFHRPANNRAFSLCRASRT